MVTGSLVNSSTGYNVTGSLIEKVAVDATDVRCGGGEGVVVVVPGKVGSLGEARAACDSIVRGSIGPGLDDDFYGSIDR